VIIKAATGYGTRELARPPSVEAQRLLAISLEGSVG
jgi:hypothetical protein